MIPLWVNLPTKDKMTPPGYQTVLATEIPSMTLRGDAGQIRVIARSYDGLRGSIPRT